MSVSSIGQGRLPFGAHAFEQAVGRGTAHMEARCGSGYVPGLSLEQMLDQLGFRRSPFLRLHRSRPLLFRALRLAETCDMFTTADTAASLAAWAKEAVASRRPGAMG